MIARSRSTEPILSTDELRRVEQRLERRRLRNDRDVTLQVWEVEALVKEVRNLRHNISARAAATSRRRFR